VGQETMTKYGLDSLWFKSRWGRDFVHLSRPALGPTQSPVQWIPDLFLGVKRHDDVHLPHQAPGTAIPLLPLWPFLACYRMNFCGDWMELAQNRERWQALVSMVMNFRVP